MKIKQQTHFFISHKLIWLSSISLGILTSIPKIMEHHFVLSEAAADFFVTTCFSLLIWYYNSYAIPAYSKKTGNNRIFSLQLFRGLGVGLIFMLVLSYAQYYLFSHLTFGPRALMFEVRGVLINLTFYMFIHLLYQTYLNQQVVRELERSMTANLAAQYELLKQQVNPHFLFNSLNTLKYMVESQDIHAPEFIVKLADFYRFTLDSLKLDVITVGEEMDILGAYVYLLKARFEDGVEVSNLLPDTLKDTVIPPFTLQLLVENCIKHNSVSQEKPLRIRLFATDGYLVVENNVQARKHPAASTGVGLENIRQRYSHLTEQPVEALSGTETFTVKLPIIHGYPHH